MIERIVQQMSSPRFSIIFAVCIALTACSPVAPQGDTPSSSSSDVSQVSSSSSSADSSSSSLTSVASEDTGNLSFPFVTSQKDTQKLYLLKSDGIHPLLSYAEHTADGGGVIAYILNEGKIYIAGVGPQKFTVLDFDRTDRTSDYNFLEGKTFGISSYFRIDADRYAYVIHQAEADSQKKDGLYVHRISTNVETFVPVETFGVQGLESVMPLCMSADGISLYVRYQGWEGFSYGKVWRVRLPSMIVQPIITNDDHIYQYHCRDRSDVIVATRTGVNPSMGMGGAATSPSAVVLFHAAQGTSQVLVDEQDALIESAFLSPDGTKIVYTKITRGTKPVTAYDNAFYGNGSHEQVLRMDTDGTHQEVIGDYDDIKGMSRDGSTLLLKKWVGEEHSASDLFQVTDGRATKIASEWQTPDPLWCEYGMGFDCMYH